MSFPKAKILGKKPEYKSIRRRPELIKIFLCWALIIFPIIFLGACRGSQKIEMRSLVPKDGLVYLETNDLAQTLESLTGGQAFQTLAAKTPDFSALKNLQLAVVITGFQTSGENSVLNLTPQFVAVAETHRWSWQACVFVENQLDNFVRKNYGEEATRETTEKDSGRFYTWTAADKRQVFAFVEDSRIYFGNDAAAIEKCLAVRRGEAESLLVNESLTKIYSVDNLAFGYVSPEGIREIANLAAISLAVGTTEEPDERNFISQILPQILQKTTREIVWTANKTERGIEDKFSIAPTMETLPDLKEILATGAATTNDAVNFLPPQFSAATRYKLKNPSTAWRGLIGTTAKNIDEARGNLLTRFSNSLLEPYGVADAETFLSQIDSEIITVQFDAESEKSATIVGVKDFEKLKTSISKEINFQAAPQMQGAAQIWFSADKTFAVAFVGNKLILGDGEGVLKCVSIGESERKSNKNRNFQQFSISDATAATFGTDYNSAEEIVEVLAGKKSDTGKLATFYLTETRLNGTNVERTTVSDFGLIGTIIKQVGK